VFRRTNWGAAVLVAAVALEARALAQLETRASLPLQPNVPYSLVVGDFNRDGKLDVAEVNFLPAGSVGIFLGNGDGTFGAASSYAVAVLPLSIAAASLRGNGILDLVVSDKLSDDVWVMLGNGDGTFQTPVPSATTAESTVVTLGDFTGRGNIDILALEGTDTQGIDCNCVEVLPGNGDGTFGAPITTPVPYNITGFGMVAGDFNNDGKLDLAVGGGFFSTYQIDILLGNGDGTFSADGYYPVGALPGSIAVGRFTTNKNVDLAAGNETAVAVLLGNGDGTFQQAAYYDTWFPSWVVAEDFNGDGKIDLIASNAGLPPQYPPGVTVFKGAGNGTFQAGVFYPAGKAGDFVGSGDFNGDHKPDLALLDSSGYAVITMLNTGVVSFSPTTPLNFKKQAVGTKSNPLTVILTNTGSTALRIASMKASTEFAVTSTCGASVAAGAKCTISATFSPTQKGARQGTISIIDSASTRPQVIELLGTGT
jgi:hypothetical protein